jgi:hypothetical protein
MRNKKINRPRQNAPFSKQFLQLLVAHSVPGGE